MVLSDRQKGFIKTNREILRDLFKSRIDEIVDQALTGPRDQRHAKLDLANEFLAWLKEIEDLTNPQEQKQESPI